VADIVKFVKSLTVRWYGHIKRTNNEGMTKQIVNARIGGTKESRRSREKTE
jgi:hypothetical protein